MLYHRLIRALKKNIFILLCPLLLIPVVVYSGEIGEEECGGMVGVSLTFGTRVNRLGGVAKAYCAGSQFQLNGELAVHYNFSTFGPPLSGPEVRASLGGVYGWGNASDSENLFLSPVSNQMGRKYSFAYSYNYYWDTIGTTQPTGTLALQWDAVHLISENDILAFRGGDKYRTGAATIAYREEKTWVAVKTVLWTGDTGKNTRRVRGSDYPSRFGYRDMRQAPHGSYSHGVLSGQLQYAWSGFQTAAAEFGIDSEKIRNLVQNKFIHDMIFIPDRWVAHENQHVPMLDSRGGQYLFKEGQTIKPAEPFMAVGINPALFY